MEMQSIAYVGIWAVIGISNSTIAHTPNFLQYLVQGSP